MIAQASPHKNSMNCSTVSRENSASGHTPQRAATIQNWKN